MQCERAACGPAPMAAPKALASDGLGETPLVVPTPRRRAQLVGASFSWHAAAASTRATGVEWRSTQPTYPAFTRAARLGWPRLSPRFLVLLNAQIKRNLFRSTPSIVGMPSTPSALGPHSALPACLRGSRGGRPRGQRRALPRRRWRRLYWQGSRSWTGTERCRRGPAWWLRQDGLVCGRARAELFQTAVVVARATSARGGARSSPPTTVAHSRLRARGACHGSSQQAGS